MGRYIPRDSPLHRLDPRTKLGGTLLYAALVLVAHGWLGVALAACFTVLSLVLGRLRVGEVWHGNRGLLGLVLLTIILNVLFTPGTAWLHLGPVTVTRQGATQGVRAGLRLGLLILQSAVLTATTSPLALTAAAERLLAPLSRVGVPAHDLALMATIALRFIPTLSEEAQRIARAQAARGARVGAYGRAGLRAIVAMLVPLFLSVFRRAEDLAVAMESRGYQGEQGRSRWREMRMGGGDAVAGALLVALATVVLWVR